MNELLQALPPGAVVLDLGCAAGSFRAEGNSFTVVRIDLEPAHGAVANFAQADAARLPFRDGCIDLIVSNHSLEHFENLGGALGEIARVIKPQGALYVSVPDVTTVCDRLYRWLARGGGHVNPFSSAQELATKIEAATGLKHAATRTLCTSLSFLNRKNRHARAPRKLLLLGAGTEASLRLFHYVSRTCDRWLHTRWSVYGWALYFGNVAAPIDCHAWTNVCIRCGSGHPSGWLQQRGAVSQRHFFPSYACPDCGTRNFFADDRRFKYS
ncbi:MAG TPA: class I SAM-dependent methyltransferase [Bryobacteraceae bacterium]|nr:class I SAM-dependent methyltransferase [Bryobacteraceae bacterium]